MKAHDPVDLIVLSGFLGSGKTSLLVDFLRQDEAGDTGVIVNEVGEIGVDGAIVMDDTDALPMTLLANGCVCCSLRSSLVQTVSALLDAPRPEGRGPLRRIILETSGLSRPGPILASLGDPEIADRVRASVVTTFDCKEGAWRDEQFEEAAAQFAAAQRIVLTKTDTVTPEQLVMCRIRAEAINPLAQIVATHKRTQAVCEAFDSLQQSSLRKTILSRSLRQPLGQHNLQHPRIHVLTGHALRPMEWVEFSEWLDNLAGLCGDRLLRLKAIVHVTDSEEPILVQSVGSTFGVPRKMMKATGNQDIFVIILRDLGLFELQEMLPEGPMQLENVNHRLA